MAKEAAQKKEEDAKEEKKEEKKDDKKEAAKDDKKEGGEGGEAKEGEAAEGAGGEAAAKKSKKKLIIIGAVALVVLLGGAVGAYFAFFSKNEEAVAEDEGSKAAKTKVYYKLPEFLVNLNSGGKQTSFLKTTIVLELESSLDIQPLEGELPRLMDALNTYLRELRASDLSGSAGIQRLREELLLRSNKAVEPIKINDILFKEIIVQ